MYLSLLGPTARQDPSAAFRQLREAGGLVRIPDRPGWIVPTYREAISVLGNPETFSSTGMPGEPSRYGIVSLPPQSHLAERQRIAPLFGRKALAPMQERLDTLADELVSAVPRNVPVDLHAAVAWPMSRQAMAQLTGVSVELLEELREKGGLIELARLDWLITGGDDLSPQRVRTAEIAIRQQTATLRDLARTRAATNHWPDDLTTQILGGPFPNTRAELKAMTFRAAGAWLTLPNGGLNSVSSLIAHVIVELASSGRITPWPDVDSGALQPFDVLRAGERSTELFLSEVLRLSSVSQWVARTVAHEAEVASIALSPGEHIVCLLGSANRDPEHFADPDTLVADRDPNPAIAFGYGPHLCVGREFARMQARAVMGALERQAKSISIESLEWVPSNLMRSPSVISGVLS